MISLPPSLVVFLLFPSLFSIMGNSVSHKSSRLLITVCAACPATTPARQLACGHHMEPMSQLPLADSQCLSLSCRRRSREPHSHNDPTLAWSGSQVAKCTSVRIQSCQPPCFLPVVPGPAPPNSSTLVLFPSTTTNHSC